LDLDAEVMTSTVDIKDDSRGRPVQKAKVRVQSVSFYSIIFGAGQDLFGLGLCESHTRTIIELLFKGVMLNL
jgi:hypothetical protein